MTNQQALHKKSKNIPQNIIKSDLFIITHKNDFQEMNRLSNENKKEIPETTIIKRLKEELSTSQLTRTTIAKPSH